MSQTSAPYASAVSQTAAGGTTCPPLSIPRPSRPRAWSGRRIAALSMASVLTMLGLLAGAVPTASAARTPGRVIAWGYNSDGQSSVPPDVANKTITAIAAGGYHSLVLTSEGHVDAWGSNADGQIDVPASLTGQRVTAVSAGVFHSLALTSEGQVAAWGLNGDGVTDVPTSLAGQTVTAIAAGAYHNMALTSDGQISAWGSNPFGGTDVPSELADQTVTAIAAGGYHSLALTSNGQIFAWGDNDDGQADIPASLASQTVTAIAAGWDHSLALTSDGQVIAWGNNGDGESDVPASLADQTVIAIAAGLSRSLALTSDGKVIAWGLNNVGQTEIPASLDDETVTAIAAGGYHNLVIASAAPMVTTSPSSTRVEVGAAVTFTAAATGTPEPTVQWQRANPGGGFVNIPGATSTTYTIDPVTAADDLDRFRAVFTNAAGTITADVATLTVNSPPTAESQTLTTAYETPLEITLTGTDPEDDAVEFTIVQAPTSGTLTGTSPNLTYTPDQRYEGPDSFAFTSSDGTYDSAVASVDITVEEQPNLAPTATSRSLTTGFGTPLDITLSGTDPNEDPLTYTVVEEPTHGTLTGTGADRTYTPYDGYEGPDSFTFTSSDGTFTSKEATVAITVSEQPNRAPTATSQTLTTAFETPLAITLTGEDPDGDTLTYTVADEPTNGTLSGTGANRTYTPNYGYEGPDSFSFTSTDGTLTSEEAAVTITVEEQPNRAPIATNQTLTTPYETPLEIALTGTDPDGDPLTYSVGQPAHGTITGTGADRTYTPAAGYEGPDSFTYTSSDGTLTSEKATVSITVAEQANRAPTAQSRALTTPYETSLDVTLSGTDPDQDPLTYAIVKAPSHGTLSGSGANQTYTPDDDYRGPDSFTFTSNDGTLTSTPATVSITVAAQSCATASAKQEFVVHADTGKVGLVRSPEVTTTRAQLLVALVSVNGPVGGTQSVAGLTGGGLTWTLVKRANATTGTTETWQAYAPSALIPTRVTATLAKPGYTASMTVAGFSGALPLVGASAQQSGTASQPKVTLTPQASQSIIWAAGRVVGARYYPAVTVGQKIVHSQAVTTPGAGYWTQRVDEQTSKGQPVTVGTKAATLKTWGYAAVEIRSNCG